MQLSSKLNTPTTRSEIRSAAIYSLSARFYAINLILLAILALAFLWWSRHESLDIAISQRWFDPLTRRFPWQHNRWLDLINHRLMKDVIIAGAVLLRGLQQRDARRVLVALLFGMGPLVVGMLKAHSAHSCPWDLALFGGNAASFPLRRCRPTVARASAFRRPCFQRLCADGAVFVVAGASTPRALALAVGIACGLLMGYGGDAWCALFSHNLWAGWWVWLSQLLILPQFLFG